MGARVLLLREKKKKKKKNTKRGITTEGGVRIRERETGSNNSRE